VVYPVGAVYIEVDIVVKFAVYDLNTFNAAAIIYSLNCSF